MKTPEQLAKEHIAVYDGLAAGDEGLIKAAAAAIEADRAQRAGAGPVEDRVNYAVEVEANGIDLDELIRNIENSHAHTTRQWLMEFGAACIARYFEKED